jgi:predicted permease
LADTLVLRPLTVPRAGGIVNVTTVLPQSGVATPTSAALSYPDYVEVRDRSRSFESLAAYQFIVVGVADRSDQPAERKFGLAVSGNLFDTLGVQPALGRPFGVEQDRVAGRDAVVVLDHGLWQRQFAADPGIVGRRVRISEVEMTVIGVMPRDFTGPDQFVLPAFYVPLAMVPRLLPNPAGNPLERRDLRNLVVKGRLRPGVTVAQADDEVQIIASSLEQLYPATNRNHGMSARTEFGARVRANPQLAVMAGMLVMLAVVVLVAACANVAGLLASRAPVRATEMAVRLSLGASRPRIVRQLLSESLLLAVIGGASGLAIGSGVIRLFQQFELPSDVPLKFSFEFDRRALVVGLAVAALSALMSSLIPAWQSTRVNLVTRLKTRGEVESRPARLWGRHALVAIQVSLSLVLLTVAVFLYRGYQSELARGPGFRTDHILLMSFDPELARYDTAQTESFYRLLTERVKGVPGVRSVALASAVPLDQITIENTSIVPEGFRLPQGSTHVNVLSSRVDEGYFETIRTPIVRGRSFRTTDTDDAPDVAVVNETFAARYWAGEDVIGKRFQLNGQQDTWIEIVGVAADTKVRTLQEAATAFVYYPRRQRPAAQSTLLVETENDPMASAALLRDAVHSVDPNMPVLELRSMTDFYEASAVTFSLLLVRLVGAMGTTGLVLALTGLYALMAYSVSRRTREIGIRMAVGARPASVLKMVLGQGVWLATAGVVLGVVASSATSGLLRAVFPFPGMGATDLATYLLVVPALLLVTVLAALVPAWHAARVDPLVALRQE